MNEVMMAGFADEVEKCAVSRNPDKLTMREIRAARAGAASDRLRKAFGALSTGAGGVLGGAAGHEVAEWLAKKVTKGPRMSKALGLAGAALGAGTAGYGVHRFQKAIHKAVVEGSKKKRKSN